MLDELKLGKSASRRLASSGWRDERTATVTQDAGDEGTTGRIERRR